MADSLHSRAARGAFWSLVDAIGGRLVQFVIGVILARLLLPEQFGLIGMLAIFIAVAQALLDSGFSSALIQKKEVSEIDCSSVFYFNVGIGLALTSILYWAAPWIAAFYSQPILTGLTRAMSVVIVINAFSAIHVALLAKELDFRTQAWVSLSAVTCSGFVGVFLALRGFGVWSLVAQQVSLACFRAILFWVLNHWRPTLQFSLQSLRGLFAFGSRLLAAGMLDTLFNNIYSVVIGKLFTPADLGFFTRAKQLKEVPSLSLSRMIMRVTFPVLSSIQDDNNRLKNVMRRTMHILLFIIVPAMIGLAVVSESLVRVLLTDRWLPCVPYLRILCIVGALYPVHALNLSLLKAKGRSGGYLRLEILKKFLLAVSIVLTYKWGIEALLWGQVTVSLVSVLINSFYTHALVGYSVKDQCVDALPYLVMGMFMGLGVHLLSYIEMPPIMLLGAQIICGMCIYALMTFFLAEQIREELSKGLFAIKRGQLFSASSRG